MRVLGAWPHGTAFNCDFVDRTRATVGPDERVIDLQVDLEDMPGWGLLCIHEETVRSFVALLGWTLEDPDEDHEQYQRVIATNDALREENTALRKALTAITRKPTDIPEVLAS